MKLLIINPQQYDGVMYKYLEDEEKIPSIKFENIKHFLTNKYSWRNSAWRREYETYVFYKHLKRKPCMK